MSKINRYPDSIGKIIHEINWSSKAHAYVLRGDALIQKKTCNEARQAYETALNIQPDNYDAFAGLDYIEYLEKPFDERFQWGGNDVPSIDSDQREENANLNRREFKNRQRRLSSLPRMIMLELTTKCNFSCFHCGRTYFPVKKTDLDQHILKNLLETVLPNTTWVTVTGFGEQTISNLYHHLMSHLVDLNVTIHERKILQYIQRLTKT
jgi:tetratricopeptide (TPR) repeat protein